LNLHESLPVIDGWFNITYVRNTGAAFGMLANADPAFRVPFFILVPLLALVSIAWLFKKLPAKDLQMAFALALVLSGAIGNLIDRLVYGYVIDFLSFYNHSLGQFPAFNVADSAITVGVALLMLDMLRNPNALENTASKQKQP
jgi:signal peptidase II